MSQKLKFLKVTIERTYAIPMHDDKSTEINGWNMEQVIDDWFKKYSLDSWHATRDTYQVGNATKFIKAEVVDNI